MRDFVKFGIEKGRLILQDWYIERVLNIPNRGIEKARERKSSFRGPPGTCTYDFILVRVTH